MKIYKKICVLFILVGTLIGVGIGVAHAEEYIGDMYYNDTTAYIDLNQIPVYIFNDLPYIVAEDLNGYGFDVKWVQEEQTLYLEYNRYKQYFPYDRVDFYLTNTYAGSVYSSNIKVMLNGEVVPSYSLSGRMLISLDELYRIGRVNWYNESKTIGFTTHNFRYKNRDWQTLLQPLYIRQKVLLYDMYSVQSLQEFFQTLDGIDIYTEVNVSSFYINTLVNAKDKLEEILKYVQSQNVHSLYEKGNLYHLVYNSILGINAILDGYFRMNGSLAGELATNNILYNMTENNQSFSEALELSDTIANKILMYIDFDFIPTQSNIYEI